MNAQLHLKAASGKSTSNYPISTHTSHPASALRTASSTQISTSCKLGPDIRGPNTWKKDMRRTDTGNQQPANTWSSARSGSVCLDVINQTWSPMYDMINIFEAFLPHLLRYPNPSDPLNGEAAALMLRDPKGYESKVRGKGTYPKSEAWNCGFPACLHPE